MKVTFDRESAIGAEMDRYAEDLRSRDGNDLFNDGGLYEQRANMIAATVEDFEAQLEDQDNWSLFGDSTWEKMCDEKIDALLEGRREALEAMADDELQAALPGVTTAAP